MINQISEAEGSTDRSRKNSIRIIAWSLAFAGTMVIADKAVLYEWYSSDLLATAAIVFNALNRCHSATIGGKLHAVDDDAGVTNLWH